MKHSIFLCFSRAFGKFSCEIRIKTGFLLFGSMRGVYLYFVAKCAFVPTRTVLTKCYSACLLISMVCSAVFLGLIGWIIDRGCRPVCFFSWRAYSNHSRAYLPSDRTAPRDSRRWWVLVCRTMFLFADVFVCFAVPDVLRTAVTSACWSGGFLFRFWAADPTSRAVNCVLQVVVFIRFSRRCAAIFSFFLDWLLCFISVVGAHLTVLLSVFSRFFCVFLNICRFLLRLIRVVCFCNKC